MGISPKAIFLTALLIAIIPNLAVSQETCNAPGARENLAKAEAFLASNNSKEGVITTESGLQYKVLKPGSGDKHPRSRDMVSTHYTLTNIDGKKLESSHDRFMPLQFVVTEVIDAWEEALALMTEGQQVELYVHPDLGYGCKGSPPNIGPMELLIFDLRLLSIVR